MLEKLKEFRRRFVQQTNGNGSRPTRSGAFRVYDTSQIIQSYFCPVYVDLGALLYSAETDIEKQLMLRFALSGSEITDFTSELRKGILKDILCSDQSKREGIVFEENGRDYINLEWLRDNLKYIAAYSPESPFKKTFFKYIERAVPELIAAGKNAQPDKKGIKKLTPAP